MISLAASCRPVIDECGAFYIMLWRVGPILDGCLIHRHYVLIRPVVVYDRGCIGFRQVHIMLVVSALDVAVNERMLKSCDLFHSLWRFERTLLSVSGSTW